MLLKLFRKLYYNSAYTANIISASGNNEANALPAESDAPAVIIRTTKLTVNTLLQHSVPRLSYIMTRAF